MKTKSHSKSENHINKTLSDNPWFATHKLSSFSPPIKEGSGQQILILLQILALHVSTTLPWKEFNQEEIDLVLIVDLCEDAESFLKQLCPWFLKSQQQKLKKVDKTLAQSGN